MNALSICKVCAEAVRQTTSSGDRSTDTDAREVNVTRLSSAHKQIAHGSTRAWHASASFCTDCHARGNGQSTCSESHWTDPHHLPLQHFSPLGPETAASHEHLLLILSKIDPLPQLQTIQWIPRGLDRRYAAIRLQALDRAMQAARANPAAPTQRTMEQDGTPHRSLDSAGGTWPQATRKKGWAA